MTLPYPQHTQINPDIQTRARTHTRSLLQTRARARVHTHTHIHLPQHTQIVAAVLAAAPHAATAVDLSGRTPLHLLASSTDPSLDTMSLLAAPAAAATTDRQGLLPLHRALMSTGSAGVIDALLTAHPEAAASRCGGSAVHRDSSSAPQPLGVCGSLPLHLLCQALLP